MDIIAMVASFVSAHPALMPVVVVLFALSEALPYFPNIEANNIVQLVTNMLKLLKEKLSLTEKSETPPAQQ